MIVKKIRKSIDKEKLKKKIAIIICMSYLGLIATEAYKNIHSLCYQEYDNKSYALLDFLDDAFTSDINDTSVIVKDKDIYKLDNINNILEDSEYILINDEVKSRFTYLDYQHVYFWGIKNIYQLNVYYDNKDIYLTSSNILDMDKIDTIDLNDLFYSRVLK